MPVTAWRSLSFVTFRRNIDNGLIRHGLSEFNGLLGCLSEKCKRSTTRFTDLSANAIGRITPTGEIREYAIPTAHSLPLAIAAGADGNIWFGANHKFIKGRHALQPGVGSGR